MMDGIQLEPIKFKSKFTDKETLSEAEVKKALDYVVYKIDKNLEEFAYKYPTPTSFNNIYKSIDNVEWTNGFWTGMLWLAYEYTGNEKYRKVAEMQICSYKERIEKKIEVDHHRLGFLYSLSCVAAYKLTGNEEAKDAAIMAAEHLLTRYQEKGKFIQAWGTIGIKYNYRLVIDSLINITLLYWATEVTGDKKYYEAAYNHYVTSVNNIIRKDASVFHTFYFDKDTGTPLKGVLRQGYSEDSCWARGQAWAIYGVSLTQKYVKNIDERRTYKCLLNYFLNRLPKDNICCWDLIFGDADEQLRDSSAAAIAICGMLEMDKYLLDDDDKEFYKKSAKTMLKTLIENYTTINNKSANGILLHGVYSWNSGKGVDESNIWGDYYYMEALMRVYKS